jgi:hypothetical protein
VQQEILPFQLQTHKTLTHTSSIRFCEPLFYQTVAGLARIYIESVLKKCVDRKEGGDGSPSRPHIKRRFRRDSPAFDINMLAGKRRKE